MAHKFSAAARGALTKREAERQARALRNAGKAARVGRVGQAGFRVIVESSEASGGLMAARRFKFDRGDWVAERDHRGEWNLVGKVRDADSESITVVDRNGCDRHFAVGEDPIIRAYWRGRRWFVR